MKLFSNVFIIATVSISCLYMPNSYGFNIAQNICEYVAVDEKNRLRKLLKSNRLKLRDVFGDVLCNGDNILIFAAKNNANEVGELLIKKLPKDTIAGELENLATLSPTLAELGQARVN